MNFKFRGISIATGCWVYGGIYSANDIFYIIEPIGYNTPVMPGTVSMLTGKKDKNERYIPGRHKQLWRNSSLELGYRWFLLEIFYWYW